MSLTFVPPLGYYPPLLWDDSKELNGFAQWGLIFLNFLMRFVAYPFNFIFSALVTLGFVIAATFCNLVWLLGGMASDFWSDSTKKLNQIVLTRLPWLFFDAFGFLWNQCLLFAGLFYTPLGASTVSGLTNFIEPLTKSSLFHWSWAEPHQKLVKRIALFLSTYGLHRLQMIFCTLVAEPVESILFGLRIPQGFGFMNNYGLNPVSLTEAQLPYAPILCIHGNYHNQSAWIPLAEYFEKQKYPAPIYTLNLPAGAVSEADVQLLDAKIKSIEDSYAASYQATFNEAMPEGFFKLNLVGHSRGAYLAGAYCYQGTFYNTEEDQFRHDILVEDNTFIPNSKINKACLIGHSPQKISAEDQRRTSKVESKKIYMNGRYDTLLFFSAEPEAETSQSKLYDTGHLGLLSDKRVLADCHSQFFNPSSVLLSGQQLLRFLDKELRSIKPPTLVPLERHPSPS